jgi:hypothetical protein
MGENYEKFMDSLVSDEIRTQRLPINVRRALLLVQSVRCLTDVGFRHVTRSGLVQTGSNRAIVELEERNEPALRAGQCCRSGGVKFKLQ